MGYLLNERGDAVRPFTAPPCLQHTLPWPSLPTAIQRVPAATRPPTASHPGLLHTLCMHTYTHAHARTRTHAHKPTAPPRTQARSCGPSSLSSLPAEPGAFFLPLPQSTPGLAPIQVHARASARLHCAACSQHTHIMRVCDTGCCCSCGGSMGGGGPPDQGPPIIALHAYHGFGANLHSWAAVQSLMAEAISNSVVTSHDMPGFGLTER